MRAISIRDTDTECWKVAFDDGLLTMNEVGVTHYSIIMEWLKVNASSDSWIITNRTTLMFRDHTDAMLCYVRFATGV